ncbi:unnamed protein product [Paramecium octaurelia]|uniref:Uncharacterized protein n=1 Tax=Paramecium octaurelia TaxID=43137 RepID=A0A8S1UIA7_PAROT|nr:unnamed protein product [Paramecium octaurelia]
MCKDFIQLINVTLKRNKVLNSLKLGYNSISEQTFIECYWIQLQLTEEAFTKDSSSNLLHFNFTQKTRKLQVLEHLINFLIILIINKRWYQNIFQIFLL